MSFHVPEISRLKGGRLSSDSSYGNNGAFGLSFRGYTVVCIASDGEGWEHCSVSIDRSREPGWDVMCFVKDLFWDEQDVVIQFHPAKDQYVNNHPYVLHLWRKIGEELKTPPSILVGIK